ncbi:hypothetical protein GCM10010428_55480 [Actinosynnema pretiosum subsp. pretiosum]
MNPVAPINPTRLITPAALITSRTVALLLACGVARAGPLMPPTPPNLPKTRPKATNEPPPGDRPATPRY